MSKRSRDPCDLAVSNILPGFRTTRSNREFNPFAQRAVDVVLEDVDAQSLIAAGRSQQEAVYESGEVDEIEQPATRLQPLMRSPAHMPELRLLSNLVIQHPLLPPAPIPYIPNMALSDNARRKAKVKHYLRERRRLERWQEQVLQGSSLKAVAVKKIKLTVSKPTVVDFQPVKLTGWCGPRNPLHKRCICILSVPDALRHEGLRLLKWDGKDTRVIRTRDHTRFVVLGGRPGTDWEQTVSGVRRLCEWALENFHLPANYKDHRRGKYGTFGGGVSFGNGRTEPGGFKMSAHNAAVFQKVLESPEMQRVARYCDQLLLAYFPRVHALLTNLLDQILHADDELQHIFPGCCYAAFHLNMGDAASSMHNDWLNGIFTGCGVFNGGDHDFTRGGHLILWDLGLVIEFPPGCLIILPSALVTHSNIPIGPGERRHSAVFFTAAGLLRWYHNGMMSDKEFTSSAQPKQLAAWKRYKEDLWKVALEMMRGD